MYVLAVLVCVATASESDHEIDTRSGEATCTTCGYSHTVEDADLLAFLEDA